MGRGRGRVLGTATHRLGPTRVGRVMPSRCRSVSSRIASSRSRIAASSATVWCGEEPLALLDERGVHRVGRAHALLGHPHEHPPPVGLVAHPLDQPLGLEPVDQRGGGGGPQPGGGGEHAGGLRAVGQPVEAAQVGRPERQGAPDGVVVGLHAALVALHGAAELGHQLTTRHHSRIPFDNRNIRTSYRRTGHETTRRRRRRRRAGRRARRHPARARRDGARAPPRRRPRRGLVDHRGPQRPRRARGAGGARRRPRRSATRAGSTGCTAPPAATSATSRSACRSTTAPSRLTLKRSALAVLLGDAARHAGADVRLGAEVVSVHDDAEGVRAVLADGSVVTGDLLVAADGVRSPVRRSHRPAGARGEVRGAHQLRRHHPRHPARRRPHPAGLALRVRAPVVLRRPPAAHRRRRVVRQRAAPRDRSRGAGGDHRAAVAGAGWRGWSPTTRGRHPPWWPRGGSSSRATAPSTCRTCRPGGAGARCWSGMPRTPRRRAAARAPRWRSRMPWCSPGRSRRTAPTGCAAYEAGAARPGRGDRQGRCPQQQRQDPRPPRAGCRWRRC